MTDCAHCGEPASLRYLRQDLCGGCAPVDEYRFDSCSICERPIDVAECPVPLCEKCTATSKAHAQLDRDARDYPDPDRRN